MNFSRNTHEDVIFLLIVMTKASKAECRKAYKLCGSGSVAAIYLSLKKDCAKYKSKYSKNLLSDKDYADLAKSIFEKNHLKNCKI